MDTPPVNPEWGEWGTNTERTALVHQNGYGIDLTEFRTIPDITFWTIHLAGKDWVTARTLANLATAFRDINWAAA